MLKKLMLFLLIAITFIFINLATLGLFKFLGVSYKNNLFLIIFLGLFYLIEFIIDSLKILITNKDEFSISFIFINTLISISIADKIMESVSFSYFATFAAAFIFTALELFLEKSEP